LNLANCLTLLRIAATVPLVYLLLQNNVNAEWLAAIVFALAASLDAVDGYVARKFNQITELGKFLDPVADKLLVISALMAIAFNQRNSETAFWVFLALAIIVAREVFITVVRMTRMKQKKELAAGMEGKLKAALQMLAIIMLILNLPFAVWALWVSVVLTIYSGWQYGKVYFCIL
jgi:CDP-diacylglycerol--glycerol-3-phosphate 3-phosphatidyltransferase